MDTRWLGYLLMVIGAGLFVWPALQGRALTLPDIGSGLGILVMLASIALVVFTAPQDAP